MLTSQGSSLTIPKISKDLLLLFAVAKNILELALDLSAFSLATQCSDVQQPLHTINKLRKIRGKYNREPSVNLSLKNVNIKSHLQMRATGEQKRMRTKRNKKNGSEGRAIADEKASAKGQRRW